MDIHNYQKRFDRTVQRLTESQEVIPDNKEIILRFKNYCLSEGIGVAKIERYLYDAMKFSSMLGKPFPQASKEDLRAVVAGLETSTWSAETKKCFKVMIRKIYRFIETPDEKKELPDKVKWISINIGKNHRKLPEELITDAEIEEIVKHAGNVRDKAFLSCLAESGARIGEIGTMKIKHVSFEQHGARLTIQGKTGMRKILVISCTPFLNEWINQHPNNEDSESYLWVSNSNNILSYTRLSAILKTAANRAGIRKRVYPHLLRHSKATRFASVMPEASMKQYFGWDASSKMCGVYIHMNGEMVDNAILEANGIELEKKQDKPILEPKKCFRCHNINPATNRICGICGLPLDKEEAERILQEDIEKSEVDNIMSSIVKDKDALKVLIDIIKEKKASDAAVTALQHH